MNHSRTVLDFWFGREPMTPARFAARQPEWFGGRDPEARAARDRVIGEQFGALTARAAAGELDAWADSPRQRLALILLLDQFPRHIHRGTALAFATDDRAAALTLDGMQKAADATLDPAARSFFYMPLQHSEALDVQEESVAAFRRLRDESPPDWQPLLAGSLDFAEKHRDIVRRFGRFPHRNGFLGRASTPEEIAWFEAGGERFGS
ncbi:MAG: DUF924 domain-containing protein [Sinobacteraceae bacterium]|nr:DUF924 domain-containing protein [Nevskiaceae bacterium]MCP5339263.1 DUF924 domain-containing protein [Nevskiaceae bacterium]